MFTGCCHFVTISIITTWRTEITWYRPLWLRSGTNWRRYYLTCNFSLAHLWHPAKVCFINLLNNNKNNVHDLVFRTYDYFLWFWHWRGRECTAFSLGSLMVEEERSEPNNMLCTAMLTAALKWWCGFVVACRCWSEKLLLCRTRLIRWANYLAV